jgi:hypothetical protein
MSKPGCECWTEIGSGKNTIYISLLVARKPVKDFHWEKLPRDESIICDWDKGDK